MTSESPEMIHRSKEGFAVSAMTRFNILFKPEMLGCFPLPVFSEEPIRGHVTISRALYFLASSLRPAGLRIAFHTKNAVDYDSLPLPLFLPGPF